jgi:hypothetical protein
MPSTIARSLDELATWRDGLGRHVVQLGRALTEQELLDDSDAAVLLALRERLSSDKLVLAFVAEFSRGKSELINAIFFADAGPPRAAGHAGAHHHVPGGVALRARHATPAGPAAHRNAAARPVAGELRHARGTVADGAAGAAQPGGLVASAVRRHAGPARRSAAGRGAGLLGRIPTRGQPACGRRRQGRGAGLAPCGHQLPASTAGKRAWWSSTRQA